MKLIYIVRDVEMVRCIPEPAVTIDIARTYENYSLLSNVKLVVKGSLESKAIEK